MVAESIEQLLTAKSQPKAAYVAMTKAFKSKFTYFMRTIDGFEGYVEPIDDLLTESFLITLFDSEIVSDQNLLELFSLPTRNGELGILMSSQGLCISV